jgi:hypothetical protein
MGYFNVLVKEKIVHVYFNYEEEIQEVQSMEQIHADGSPAAGGGMLKRNRLEAKVEKLTQAMIFFCPLAVALVGMGVGYALK